MIDIEYIGSLREDLRLQDEHEQVEWSPTPTTVVALIDHLCAGREQQCSDIMKADNLLISVNQSMVKLDHALADGDKVGFYPPIAGG